MVRKKLDQKVYDYLLKKIKKGELLERQRITEQSLQKELGISRTPVRKALRDLAEKNYLENIPNVGVFVKEKEINQKAFQERLDFIEQLLNHYLFQLEKKEQLYETKSIEAIIHNMQEEMKRNHSLFEEQVIDYFKEILSYSQNDYTKAAILKALRELFLTRGPINKILVDSRFKYLEHFIQLSDYLKENDYPFARREFRILFNQMKLDVIEKS